MAIIEGAQFRGGIQRSPTSRIFHVDPSIAGSLQVAIDAAVAGNGDIILVKRGGHTVTSTVNFNKSGIQVIAVDDGLSPLGRGEYNSILADAALVDVPVAIVTAPCLIQGMGFVSRDSRATFFDGAALLLGGAAGHGTFFGVHLKNCRFPKWALDNRIGVSIAGGDAIADVLIEGCTFEGVGTDLAAGIYVQGAVQNLHVRNNYFRQCTYAIEHGAFAGGGPHSVYERNYCEDAKLLKAGGNAATGLLCDNFLETATDATSYDDTVAALKALGLNFSGNHYSE